VAKAKFPLLKIVVQINVEVSRVGFMLNVCLIQSPQSRGVVALSAREMQLQRVDGIS
jgi:hypothetical protein